MKTPSFAPAALGVAAVLIFGCSNHDQVAQAAVAAPTAAPVVVVQPQPAAPQAAPGQAAPAPAVVAASVTPAPPRPQADPGTPLSLITDTPSPSWDDIKNLTWEQRPDFLAGLGKIENRLDRQIGALNAKRASMTKDLEAWDFQMKEVNTDRQYLTGLNDEVSKASPDTWNQVKDKVEQALQQAQDACEKVKSTTTS